MTFLNFFFHFWKLHQILNTLRKNMMVIANVFRKLQTVKNFVRLFSKKHRFGTRFDNQHVKVSRILAKCPLRAILSCFSSFWVKLISKTSPLHLREILLVFLNTMTAEAKYPIEHSENLPLRIKIKNYLKNEKLFLDFLFCCWNLHQVLNKKTMVVIADVFPKLQTVNKFVRRLCENPRFGTCFDSQHVKVSQILAKCPFLVILSCFFIFLMEVDLENVSPSVS